MTSEVMNRIELDLSKFKFNQCFGTIKRETDNMIHRIFGNCLCTLECNRLVFERYLRLA